ncbi:hypothetical protein BC835DRAFT_1478658 [Cytidiella melzeri]|nr:hypothetical protein BC835DRAFT_1424503 [Cytidiella melzeri]KAI0696240.1 hypothetical protein BC835DRAFT_1478658 [Cytidiella melzeri]
MDKDYPSIPCLNILGSTYNALNGTYADPKSTIHQVIDWDKFPAARTQEFATKMYKIPDVVDFIRDTTTDYRSSYGKTTADYTKSLSIQAGLEASFPGFSASASADYSQSQRENLSNAFTRVTYAVNHYILSLPPTAQIRVLLKADFVNDLDRMEPAELYKEYGTHLLCSLTVGGRALFLTSTDTTEYNSDVSLEAAAKLSAEYSVLSGNMTLTTKEKEAVNNFNESSETSIVTKGGDPQYGNEDFLKNEKEWARSLPEYPEFVDFGSGTSLTAIWEFASTEYRRNALEGEYARFVALHAQNLTLPGPFLTAHFTEDVDTSKSAWVWIDSGGEIDYTFPGNLSDEWYFITPGLERNWPIVAKELVPGALAAVKEWEEIFVTDARAGLTRFWRARPPTDDYVALGVIAATAPSADALPSQPPASLVGHFRAVHRSALTAPVTGVSWYSNFFWRNHKFFSIDDNRYWFAATELPQKNECFILDPKQVVQEGDWWQ